MMKKTNERTQMSENLNWISDFVIGHCMLFADWFSKVNESFLITNIIRFLSKFKRVRFYFLFPVNGFCVEAMNNSKSSAATYLKNLIAYYIINLNWIGA